MHGHEEQGVNQERQHLIMKDKIIGYTAYLLIIIGILSRTIAKLMKLPDEPLMFYQSIVIYIGLLILYISRYSQKSPTSRIVYNIVFALLALWLTYDGYNLFILQQ